MTLLQWFAGWSPGVALWVGGLFVIFLIRLPYEIGKKRRKVVHSRVDALDIALLVLFVLFLAVLPAVALNEPAFDFADWPHRSPPSLVAGAAVMLAAIAMLARVHAALGSGWSKTLRIRESQPLVTTGVYARIRHPMYTAGLLVGLAQFLLLENWVAGLGGFAAMAGIVLVRVPREEAMMLGWYGEPYRAYMKKSGAIFPRILS